MRRPASANSWRTFWVFGSQIWSVYLSKNSPDAYLDRSKPLKCVPRSIAMRLDARNA
ncbi:Uncharacterised protein [Mycobacterium tuberculosis]|uniref:Uncharacterized protein n=1 Tax=Mycobacterium tuberculosis TaxID=1773 RepID=A0A916P7V6_MYCTX|nr:Uncharacterised protein [Mycobacterium tuberculosis]